MFRDGRANEVRGISGTVTGEEPGDRELGATTGNIMIEDIPVESVSPKTEVLSDRTEGLVLHGLDLDRLRDSIAAGRKRRIRATVSRSLSFEPLVFLDGVRLAAGLAAEDNPRLDGSHPLDIVSMEVLKTPEATELYGEDASNGALLIITKRGFTPALDLAVQPTDHVELPVMGQTTSTSHTPPSGCYREPWTV